MRGWLGKTPGISQELMLAMRMVKVGGIGMGGDLEVVGRREEEVMKEEGTVKTDTTVRKNTRS